MAGILDGLLSPLLTQTANARGQFLAGRREGEEANIAKALTQLKVKRDEEARVLQDALTRANITKLGRPDFTYDPTRGARVDVDRGVAEPIPGLPEKEATARSDVKFDLAGNAYKWDGEKLTKLKLEDAATPPPTVPPQGGASSATPPAQGPAVPPGTGKFGAKPTNPSTVPGTPEWKAAQEAAAKIRVAATEEAAGAGERKKRETALANVQTALTSFERDLQASDANILPTAAKAKLQTNYNNVLLQMKEAYNLGVLNGPDYMLMQRILSDPTSVRGLAEAYGSPGEQRKRVLGQIAEVRERMKGITATPPSPDAATDPEFDALMAKYKKP